MKNLITFIKLQKQILGLLKYSFKELDDYKFLTREEKKIITEEDFKELRKLSGCK
jgi:hypothetical protein